jgi:hypothetical protein
MAVGWAVRDRVIRLRVFGTETIYTIVAPTMVIGTAADCAIRIDDLMAGVSRKHALIQQHADGWEIVDLESTNGLRQDGEDRKSFPLAPGVEIEAGRVKLIAESARSIELHGFLRRVLGWAPSRLSDVDHALRAVREMANLRAILIVRGEGSMVSIAERLHQLVLGEQRPLSVHGRKETGLTALGRATDGMLYLDAEELPHDVQQVIVGLRLPGSRARLVIGANTADAVSEVVSLIPHVASIWIPPLTERQDEIERLLEAYAQDAVMAFGAQGIGLRPHDMKWIRESGTTTLEAAKEVMTRVVLVRNWGITGGASRAGITHGAMSRYFQRHGIPS